MTALSTERRSPDSCAGEQTYAVVDSQTVGQRLDRWLAEQVTDLSRSQLQKLIEQGQVQVNHAPCTSKKYEMQWGDQVTLTVLPPTALNLTPESIPLTILYEDAHLLIINKPVGLVVHPAPGHETGTLVHGLLAHCQTADGSDTSLSGIGGVQRPGIVHRLDKDTSGAIAIAKTDHAHRHLQAQIQAKTARREYLGLVHGKPPQDCGTLQQPIGRHPIDRKKMAIVPLEKGGRDAITHWETRQRLGNFTLMYFCLETGRTHQIRVHCASLGCPIVGDPLYSNSGRVNGLKLTGQLLHAWRLTFQHPLTADRIAVEAPLPEHFLKVLKTLEQRQRL